MRTWDMKDTIDFQRRRFDVVRCVVAINKKMATVPCNKTVCLESQLDRHTEQSRRDHRTVYVTRRPGRANSTVVEGASTPSLAC
jgi:hypothetical protein